MPIGGRPILEVIIAQLKYAGFSGITMAVGYLAELIEAYFGNGDKYGIKIDYSREDKPLGTIGSLSLIEGLDKTFVVMNGDVLTNLDYRKLLDFHEQNQGIATIATCDRQVNIDLGILELDGGLRLKQYIEKPTLTHHVSMGIYVFEPEIMEFIEANQYLDFPDLVLTLLDAGSRVVAYPFDGYWLDIGRHEDYAQALEEFETMEEFENLKEKLNIE
jgi:NDP-sugar pyrophosphorylase family protein